MVSRPRPRSAGLNFSWRNALAEVVIAAEWPDGPATADSSLKIDELKQSIPILDKLTPDSACYINEVTIFFIISDDR